jgi:limonene-1,2-epoxide hydrolase
MVASQAEKIVREFCAAWGDGKVASPPVDKIVDMFAEQGEWQVCVPSGKVIMGRVAIRAEIVHQSGFSTYMQCGIEKIASLGSLVMTERVDHFTMGGKRVEHALVAVYDLDEQGKIVSWREYFDISDLARQLGLKAEDLLAA